MWYNPGMRKCYACQDTLPLEFFYKGKYECKKCHREWQRKYRARNKDHWLTLYKEANKRLREKTEDYLFEYLLTHSCVDCGESNVLCLEFDHIRDQKVGGIMFLMKRLVSLKKIQEEIKKCDVRCRNCHMIRHQKDSWLYKRWVTHGM